MNADDHIVHIGSRQVWGGTEPFGLRRADRRQHLLCLGKTGTGKTTLLRNLLLADIEAGCGVGLIDPHGDLAEELLDYIPRSRSRDVVYFNPSDPEYPVAMNLLAPARHRPAAPHLVASGIVSALKSVWQDSWGPRLEFWLYAAVAALAECKNATLLGVSRMFVDERYREWVLAQVTDPAVRSFWLVEFAGYDRRFAAEIASPIVNKVGQLAASPPVRGIIGQVKNRIDLRFLMDNRRIFIANLAKGQIGDDKARLLGSLLVSQFEQAALSRSDTPPEKREDFHLIVDEFQNFLTHSFANIMAEARKYHLSLALSTQQLASLREDVREAVLGNAGTIVSFRIGQSDARVFAEEFGGLERSEFTELDNFEVQVKLLENGRHREPFRAVTLPPTGRPHGRKATLVRASRERYGSPRRVVEDRIRRWIES